MIKTAAIPLLLCAVSACSQPNSNAAPHGANVREEIIARMPEKTVQPFIAALRTSAPEVTGNVNISEWRGDYGGTSRADANVYVAAINDAQQKASAIARHVNARLGSIQSVTEYDGPAGAAPSGQNMRLKGSSVMVRTDGPVALAVTYGLSAGSVSVFGLADAAAHGAPKGVAISVNVNDPSIAEAWARAGTIENYVRQIGRKFGLSGPAISITNTGFDRY